MASTMTFPGPVHAAPVQRVPTWLELRPGTLARVDIAPWHRRDESEAALARSARAMQRDFTSDASRPRDAVAQPVGVRVSVVRMQADGAVLVRGLDAPWEAYTTVDRLIPEIPIGTRLIVAGGFEGFADFYPTLATTKEAAAEHISTRTRMTAIAEDSGVYDPDSADLVRVRVQVTSGPAIGRIGWVPVAFTGLPVEPGTALSSQTEKTCECRLVEFDAL